MNLDNFLSVFEAEGLLWSLPFFFFFFFEASEPNKICGLTHSIFSKGCFQKLKCLCSFLHLKQNFTHFNLIHLINHWGKDISIMLTTMKFKRNELSRWIQWIINTQMMATSYQVASFFHHYTNIKLHCSHSFFGDFLKIRTHKWNKLCKDKYLHLVSVFVPSGRYAKFQETVCKYLAGLGSDSGKWVKTKFFSILTTTLFFTILTTTLFFSILKTTLRWNLQMKYSIR